MWPISLSGHSAVLSMLFQDQSYYSGAARFNHGYDCLNIVLEGDQELDFLDFVHFSKAHSKATLCEMFNGLNASATSALTPDQRNKILKFAFVNDSLLLCFDDFELGPSEAILKVSLPDAQPYLDLQAQQYLGMQLISH